MSVRSITVDGYRSIKRLRLSLGRINVIVGPNGSGKSNLYRSMYLLSESVNGRFTPALAGEGGMPSVLWGGERGRGPTRLTLGVELDEVSYELSCGLPQPSDSAFALDPEIKQENIWFSDESGRKVYLLQRKGPSATVRDLDGRVVKFPLALTTSESLLSQIREPHLYPELSAVRHEMNDWRFYHYFATDDAAVARRPALGISTPVLSHDGHDLAAALQTISELGDADAMNEAIDRALPGAALRIDVDKQCRMAIRLNMPGMRRELEAREFSDGTLRYLYLLAALSSPRPPSLIALNEPETSLHPDLIDALAHLIVQASRHSQLWVVSHSELLAHRIVELSGNDPIRLEIVEGVTQVLNRSEFFSRTTR
ncbi:MAG: DUF2813 domain-containing protein [Planctomycetota bacterium]|nr:MAG: DUF2813 domain-containing protein [Planctomycetota bacterium]REJ96120.1 MAG: DUF2813 domain-containing protein [Planctomycetota bacterium]REK21892.1 MAG: DUF2813 domain-containing protein [Planctomycetota bacterium]REK46700.1 MAG: DUF2813 domain-containing protein [Planctomycetota bacterium]